MLCDINNTKLDKYILKMKKDINDKFCNGMREV